MNGRCDEFWLLGGAHWGWFNVFQRRQVYKCQCYYFALIAPGPFEVVRALFRIDLLLKEEIDGGDDQVGNDVKGSNTQENVGVIKWHLFRHLHHAKNNHQIGAVEDNGIRSVSFRAPGRQYNSRPGE